MPVSNQSAPSPITLYRSIKSGHCHRVQLMMSLLDVPYVTIDLNTAQGEHKTADYLNINPLGQVPSILDGDVTLSDSNAIITYLADRYCDLARWAGRDPVERAQVQRWLSIAAGELVKGPCAARLITLFGYPLDPDAAKAAAARLLQFMDSHLATRNWLVAERCTLADIALFTYISHAPEGGIALSPYPHVSEWLARIEDLPGYVSMVRSPT